MENPRIIFVDDEESLREVYELLLTKAYGESRAFLMEFHASPIEAIKSIKANPFNVALVFMDHHFNENQPQPLLGSNYIKEIKAVNSYIEVVMMSTDTTEQTLKKWLENGADKFLYKESNAPIGKIQVFISEALTRHRAKFGGITQTGSFNLGQVPESVRQLGLISISPSMLAVAEIANQCAKSDLSVLVLGETGSGKEVLAKAIHNQSPRSSFEFRTVDCTQFKNSQIIASELFGSEKGAFTGAETKAGLIELAHGGTLFLDEVHHLGPEAQGMLLRFLQDRSVRRVGGKTEKKVDVRIIFAAKPLLLDAVKSGAFLPDLYYRMKEIKIELPKLNERKEDIPLLVQHFLSHANYKQGHDKRFHPDSIDIFKRYTWPGNIRELENLIKRLVVLSPDPVIMPADIRRFGELDPNAFYEDFEDIISLDDLQRRHDSEKRKLILRAYEMSDLNMTEAAKLLGVARSSLRNYCKALGIQEVMEASNLKDVAKDRGELRRLFGDTWRSLSSVLDREA